MRLIIAILMLSLGSAPAAVFFDGSNDYITMGTATNCGGSNFTVSCRFLQRAGGATATTGTGGINAYPLVVKLVGEADGDNRDGNYFLGVATNRLAGDFEQFTGGTNRPVYGLTTLSTNRWYHGALVYDGARLVLYLDGVPDGTNTTAYLPRFDSIQHLGLGRALSSTGAQSGAFRGVLDDVRIWDRALTPGQVRALAAGATAQLPQPRGWYRLADFPPGDSANRVRSVSDLAGLNRGTITNGATWIGGVTP